MRLDRAEHNATELANRLIGHPRATRPARSRPAPPSRLRELQGAVAKAGRGPVVRGRHTDEGAEAVCNRTPPIVQANSLGGLETVIEHRARYATHVEPGTPATLLRLCVGIEDIDDLSHDLGQALVR